MLFFEHKKSYRRVRGEVPESDYVIPLGKADLKRRGRDLSIITYGIGVHLALEASQRLADEDGIDVEMLDLRTLLPLDTDAISETVARTSKVLILHEDNKTGGIGAEVAALIAETCFEELDGPICAWRRRIRTSRTRLPWRTRSCPTPRTSSSPRAPWSSTDARPCGPRGVGDWGSGVGVGRRPVKRLPCETAWLKANPDPRPPIPDPASEAS